MNILTNYKYYLNKCKYYVYPMFVILMLILEHGVFARLEHAAFKWRPANKLQT